MTSNDVAYPMRRPPRRTAAAKHRHSPTEPCSPWAKRLAGRKILAPAHRAASPVLEVQQRIVKSEQKEQNAERQKFQPQKKTLCSPWRRQRLAHPRLPKHAT